MSCHLALRNPVVLGWGEEGVWRLLIRCEKLTCSGFRSHWGRRTEGGKCEASISPRGTDPHWDQTLHTLVLNRSLRYLQTFRQTLLTVDFQTQRKVIWNDLDLFGAPMLRRCSHRSGSESSFVVAEVDMKIPFQQVSLKTTEDCCFQTNLSILNRCVRVAPRLGYFPAVQVVSLQLGPVFRAPPPPPLPPHHSYPFGLKITLFSRQRAMTSTFEPH